MRNLSTLEVQFVIGVEAEQTIYVENELLASLKNNISQLEKCN